MVGTADTADLMLLGVQVRGCVEREAVALWGLDQIVVFDGLNRFVGSAGLRASGMWSVDLAFEVIIKDNSARILRPFAARATDGLVFPLAVNAGVRDDYARFVTGYLRWPKYRSWFRR